MCGELERDKELGLFDDTGRIIQKEIDGDFVQGDISENKGKWVGKETLLENLEEAW